MKRYAPLALGTALCLLAAALAASPTSPGNGAKPKGTASRASTATVQPKPQADADATQRELARLALRQTRDSGEIAKILRNQLRAVTRFRNLVSETRLWLVLLALTTALLIGAGCLGLGWHRQKSLAAFEERMLGRLEEMRRGGQSRAAAGREDAAPRSSSAGEAITTDSPPPAIAAVAAGEPVRRPSPPRPGDQARRGAAEEAPVTIPPGMRHAEVARLLAKLRREALPLAERFADPELRERFRGELDTPVGARLERLILVSEQGEEQLQKRWLGPDLVTTLDALARFYSEAVEEERQGHAHGLARELRGWLDAFGAACRQEGWFAIDAIDPYVTPFDPRIHHAVAGRDVAGAEGRIIAVKAIGRRDPQNGAVVYKAEVIVGR